MHTLPLILAHVCHTLAPNNLAAYRSTTYPCEMGRLSMMISAKLYLARSGASHDIGVGPRGRDALPCALEAVTGVAVSPAVHGVAACGTDGISGVAGCGAGGGGNSIGAHGVLVIPSGVALVQAQERCISGSCLCESAEWSCLFANGYRTTNG